MKPEVKYFVWAIWFTASIVIVLTYLFVGILEGSKEFFPNWPAFTIGAIINLIICIIVGSRKR